LLNLLYNVWLELFLILLHDIKLENRETLAALCCINVFLFKVINDASSYFVKLILDIAVQVRKKLTNNLLIIKFIYYEKTFSIKLHWLISYVFCII
jgi:hypothetical protein